MIRKAGTGEVVVGIDVGSVRKGFHAVALRNGSYDRDDHFSDPEALAAWCVELGAVAIGVDTPCRWSPDGRARTAERQLMSCRIWCFSTPSRETACSHPKGHFDWMLNGERLLSAIQRSHVLYSGGPRPGASFVFETFPHGVACALAGKNLSARSKRVDRRGLLVELGVALDALTNMDLIDAALCAVTAHRVMQDAYWSVGDSDGGFMLLPLGFSGR